MTAAKPLPDDQNGSVRITQRQIYDVVTKMERDIIALVEVKETVSDHEKRIRELEKMVWRSSWISGLISAMLTSVATGVIMRVLMTQ